MTARKRATRSDLKKVDAYVNSARDYEEIPEATEDDFARATVMQDGAPVRGRPTLGELAKKQVTLRLDPTVIEAFKAAGPGWQSRINGWLAGRQEVVDLMATFEQSAQQMRELLEQLKDHSIGFRALSPNQEKSIASVERQIAVTETAVLGVRKVLNEQALEHASGRA